MAPHSSKQASVSIKVFLYSGFVSVDRLQEGSPDSVPMFNLVDSSVKSLADSMWIFKARLWSSVRPRNRRSNRTNSVTRLRSMYVKGDDIRGTLRLPRRPISLVTGQQSHDFVEFVGSSLRDRPVEHRTTGSLAAKARTRIREQHSSWKS